MAAIGNYTLTSFIVIRSSAYFYSYSFYEIRLSLGLVDTNLLLLICNFWKTNSSRHEVYLLLEFCPFGDMKKYLVEKREKFQACINNEPGRDSFRPDHAFQASHAV